MKGITKSIIFFILLTVIVTSCQKNDLDELNKVVYVRHEKADMPAYIYGNGSEEKELVYFEKSCHFPMVNEGKLFFIKMDNFNQKYK